MSPAVSVLLPVRDAASTLGEALDSLLRQTLSDIEILAVDDGSSDPSPEILHGYAVRDPRIVVVRSEPRGIVSALNLALERAAGRYVARHDADDLAHPERLERQVALLEAHPEIWVASSLVEQFPRESLRDGMLRYECWVNGLVRHEEIEREFFVESAIPHPTAVMRRADLLRLGGYRDVGWPEDYDLWCRVLEAGGRFEKVDRVLLAWRDGSGRLTRTSPRYSVANFLRLKAHFLARGKLRGRTGIVVWGAGPVGRRLTRFLAEEGVRVEAFVDIDPRKVGRTRRGVPVVDPGALAAWPERFVLAAVGVPGGRQSIREHLESLGREEGSTYLCVA